MRLAKLIICASVLIISCSSSRAVEVSEFDTTNPRETSTAKTAVGQHDIANYGATDLGRFQTVAGIAEKDYSQNEVLFSMLKDKLVLPFYPRFYLEKPPLPNPVPMPVQNNDNPQTAPSLDEINPVIATINSEPVRAVEFTNRMFQRHRDKFEYFLKEMFVDAVAKQEAKREGIFFTKKYLRDANQRVIQLLKQRAAKKNRSFKQVWKEQGFETEQAYIQKMRKYTARMILLEHLVFLMYLRTDKAEYSHIVISDQSDKFNPDPKGKAERIAKKLQKGLLRWEDAVRRYSQDHKSIQNGGKVGIVLKGTSGQPEIENFIFNHPAGSISEPIHTVYGYQILKIDRRIPGKPDAKYIDLIGDIEKELRRVYKKHIPGLRITTQDTFDWLEKIYRQGRYKLELFYPRKMSMLPYIARVNEKKISAGAFFRYAFEMKPEWARLTMSELLIFELAKREAKREQIKISKNELDSAMKNVLEYLKKQTAAENEGVITKDNNKKDTAIWKKLNYPDEASFLRIIRKLTKEAMLVERLILLHDLRVERIKLYQILCKSKEEAYEVRAEVIRKKDFQSVAKRFSRHKRSRKRGGLLGIVPKGTYSEDFERVAFALREGEISQPFKTEQGWHILTVTKKYPAHPNATFKELEAEIKNTLKQRGKVPGKRTTTGDMFRWVAYILGTKRYEIKTFIPNIAHFKPEAPKEPESSEPNK